MKYCLLCGQKFLPQISFLQLFSWQKKSEQCICNRCLALFERLPSNRCSLCSGRLLDGDPCADCQKWSQHYLGNVMKHHAIFQYNDAFHDLMVSYKRYGDYILCEVLQFLCYAELSKLKADFYVPLPTAPEHQAKRQFDTISAIYRPLVPLSFFLIKRGGFGAQGEKTRTDRLKTKQSFAFRQNIGPDLNFKKILLLDDIYTTGRTLYHARDALQNKFPQAQISSFSVCR